MCFRCCVMVRWQPSFAGCGDVLTEYLVSARCGQTEPSSLAQVPLPEIMIGFARVGSNVPTCPLYPSSQGEYSYRSPRLIVSVSLDTKVILHRKIGCRGPVRRSCPPHTNACHGGRISQQEVRIRVAACGQLLSCGVAVEGKLPA